jgi:hypothetical protein
LRNLSLTGLASELGLTVRRKFTYQLNAPGNSSLARCRRRERERVLAYIVQVSSGATKLEQKEAP